MRSQKKQRKKVPKREDSYCHAQQWPSKTSSLQVRACFADVCIKDWFIPLAKKLELELLLGEYPLN